MDFKTNQESSSGYARSISLPEVFRNLKTAKIFAVDIGKLFLYAVYNCSSNKSGDCRTRKLNR